MEHAETVGRVSDWMRWWAPEVKRRIDRGEALFAEVRDLYEALRKDQGSQEKAEACWAKMGEARKVLDEAPPDAYTWLAYPGRYVR